MTYCTARHPDGWLCILAAGHDPDHLSLDNRVQWYGSPGAPIWWRDEPPAVVDESMLDPTAVAGERGRITGAEIRSAQTIGFTGELCGHCGSPNTRRIGKCLQCAAPPLGCGQDGTCA